MPVRSRRPLAGLAIVGLLLLATLAVLGPILWGDVAEETSVAGRLAPPSLDHPFGTDQLGRDILSRVLAATRLSVVIAFGATAISAFVGIVFGLVPTVLPARLRRVFTGAIDILMIFPWLLLALFFSVIWGASALGAMLAVAFASVPGYARLSYNLGSSAMGRDYVKASRIVGVGPATILARHVLPNIGRPLVVNVASHAATALLAFAALSFLGLGVQPPAYDWGRLLSEGLEQIYVNPMAAIGPGIAVVVSGLVVVLVSLAFSDASDTVRPRFDTAARRTVVQTESSDDDASADRSESSEAEEAPVARARGLRVAFPAPDGSLVERVHGVDLAIAPGEVVGIVGESGSGKSVTALALAGLIEPPAQVDADELCFDGIDMRAPLSRTAADRAGVELGVVFQDPLTSLNPALRIGRQLIEASQVHKNLGRRDALRRAEDALTAVGVPEPRRRLRQYTHELSGGQRQRVMIAMGLLGNPKLLIADEPTTALDVTVQRQVMSVLRRAQERTGTAVLFISHDIALVSSFCDRVLVMKDGEVVELLRAEHLAEDARHPYTCGLIGCVPDMTTDRTRPLPTLDDADGVRTPAATSTRLERSSR